jgi:glucose/mannose transport system permease protein
VEDAQHADLMRLPVGGSHEVGHDGVLEFESTVRASIHMTTLDAIDSRMPQVAPHIPLFTSGVRTVLVGIVAAVAFASLALDWPFSRIGVFQPMMVALGFVLIQYIVDIPFQRQWQKLAVLGAFLLAAMTAWMAWYSKGAWISQAGADAVWKYASVASIFGLLGAGIWNAPFKNFHSKLASIPMMYIVLFAFIGCSLWTMTYSLSDARIYPVFKYVGFKQYTRLFGADIWDIAWKNGLIYLFLGTTCSIVTGFLLAVFMDQKIRLEGLFRTIYLYPFALSFIVTGHVWAWIFSPAYGLEKSVQQLGWKSFSFDWIADSNMAIYCIVIAGVWQGAGLVMALMLAGLRGIDDEVWKAARVDGIPTWRTYIQIVIPMMRPVLITTFVIVAAGAVRIYDLVVALTDGGPGISTTVPAQYVYKYLFSGNISQGLAAATVMLLVSAIILIPWVYVEFVKNKQQR